MTIYYNKFMVEYTKNYYKKLIINIFCKFYLIYMYVDKGVSVNL